MPHLRDAPRTRRVTGATAVAAVASTALSMATTWSAQDELENVLTAGPRA